MNQSNFRRKLLFPFCLVVLLSVGVVWTRTATVRETYQYVQNEKQLKVTKQDIQTLRVKWTRLTAPYRLMQYARDLRLAPPQINQTVKFSKLKNKAN